MLHFAGICVAVVNASGFEFGGKTGKLLVERGRDCNGITGVFNLEVFPVTQCGNFLPGGASNLMLAALNGINYNAFLGCRCQGDRVFHIVGIIHVWWCITDQEYYSVGVTVRAPGNLVDSFVEGLIDAFRTIAATLCAKIHQAGIHRVEII